MVSCSLENFRKKVWKNYKGKLWDQILRENRRELTWGEILQKNSTRQRIKEKRSQEKTWAQILKENSRKRCKK